MEKILKGKKDAPVSIYDMPFRKEWEEVWSEPRVDCIYKNPNGLMKPYAAIMYEALWSFHKEGRLHWTVSDDPRKPGHKQTKFWID